MGDKYWLYLAGIMLVANTPVAAGVFLLFYALSIKEK